MRIDEFNIRFTIIIIPYNRTEGEEHDCKRNEIRSPCAYMNSHRSLRQEDTVLFSSPIKIRQAG